MKVIMSIDECFVDELKNKNLVYAKTHWNNPYSIKAYQVLKEKNQLDEFFFAFKLNHEANLEAIASNFPTHSKIIVIEIPDDEYTFEMGYYDFSDLIYYFDCAGDDELNECGYDIINTITNHGMTGQITDPNALTNGLIQVNFNKICNEWVTDIYDYDEKLKII